MVRHTGCLAVLLGLTAIALGQDEHDEDFPPGMLARYTAGAKTVERVDADVAFVWGSGAPDLRLPGGAFEAAWESLLLIRQPGEYRFHVYVCGEAVVEVDGERVLAGERETAGWIDGAAVTLAFGEKPLKVTYRSPEVPADVVSGPAGEKSASAVGTQSVQDVRSQAEPGNERSSNGGAQIRLFWSSESFPPEPVPAHLLFREPGRPELDRVERGRVLFDAHRCGRCHARENVPAGPPGPSLLQLAAGTNRAWIVEKVQGSAHTIGTGRMPTFGFTRDEAESVAVFLVGNSRQVKLGSASKSKDEANDRRQGEVLFRSLGCLACHRVEKLGTDGPYGGGDLSAVGAKRSPEWLATWLADPSRLNADHRMPVFELSANERRQLVLYLSSLGSQADAGAGKPGIGDTLSSGDTALVDSGQRLVERARCAACHRIPGIEDSSASLPDLSRPVDDWSKSCLSQRADGERQRPAYSGLASDDADALKAYVISCAGPSSPESGFDRGRRVLERRNCLACHERDTSKGLEGLAGKVAALDEALRGQSQGLIPPALTAVGDKLVDEALARAISGEQQQRRMPWLFVRMPRFAHTPEDRAALLEYLIGHDRIPVVDRSLRERDGGEPARFGGRRSASVSDGLRHVRIGSRREPATTDDSQLLVAGHTLVGAKGFSCVACHRVGEFEPRNVALGTRGSDLLALGRSMRESYFLRWTRSPMRIVPGMEMPSFVKPVPAVLDGTIDAQLRAIWKALNDPRFTVPTDPSSVEQYLVVSPGERPRIVRDVFTNAKENGGGYVARALAIGFPNGHSVLYDLDTFSVRGWYFGDFARQRTLGKGWYWDMAGVPVMTGFDHASDFALIRVADGGRSDAGPILPRRCEGTSGRVLRYSTSDELQLDYELAFDIDGRIHHVRVEERLATVRPQDDRTGWRRSLLARHVPPGYRFCVQSPTPSLAQSRIGFASVISPAGPLVGSVPLPASTETPDAASTVLLYTAVLDRPDVPLPVREPPVPAVEKITTVPGFDGVRLPLDGAIMPTSIAWTADGTLAFTSLKGHVYLARDTDGDGIEDSLSVFEEGLAAPYGLLADGDDLLVAHKPEVLRLKDTDGDGRADVREVVATGWGYNDNYHDWTTGFARDAAGNLYIGTGSDYAQPGRPQENARWRGKVLKVAPDGTITPVAHGFRYPMGLALNAAGDLFVTDNQGVQNTFNEINHIVPGGHYGVPGRWESDEGVTPLPPALQVPHPWTRSVNGIAFWPEDWASTVSRNIGRSSTPSAKPSDGVEVRPTDNGLRTTDYGQLANHGIGCEYDSRFLMRFTLEKVGDTYQGATYYLSHPDAGAGGENFTGPLCVAVAPNGDVYVGGIHDSGWLGGQNTGEIVRLRPNGKLPNGIRELRATADGFEIEFFRLVDREAAADPENYTVSGYTRVWGGAYATPDTGRHRLDVQAITVSDDGRTVRLTVSGRKTGHVYEVTCGEIGTAEQRALWPATGHYTLHRVPAGAGN